MLQTSTMWLLIRAGNLTQLACPQVQASSQPNQKTGIRT
jgi:hypothetical protein